MVVGHATDESNPKQENIGRCNGGWRNTKQEFSKSGNIILQIIRGIERMEGQSERRQTVQHKPERPSVPFASFDSRTTWQKPRRFQRGEQNMER